jgi:hypothetical protein
MIFQEQLMAGPIRLAFALCLSPLAHALEVQPDWLMVDGLEFQRHPLQRVSAVNIRDPHFFVSPVIGCVDFTDNNILGQPNTSVNGQINTNLNADSDANGFFDASTLWIFPPTQLDRIQRLDTANGQCSTPTASSSCGFPSLTAASNYLVVRSGGERCFEPIANTTGNYTPAVPTLSPPCFVQAELATTQLDFSGLTVPLYGTRIAGDAPGNQPGGRILLRGFLRETDANSAIIPATIPLIGGRPISALLAGGTGNCSTRNDKDTFGGVSGWWFYIEQTLSPVSTTP